MPSSCAASASALTSVGEYTVPSSVDCVIETAPGWVRCSSPTPVTLARTRSGVSLPSGVSSSTSLTPSSRSGAPHSSTAMCAVRAQTTCCHGARASPRPTTFAPVPLKTKATSACPPRCPRTAATARRVTSSAPYAGAWPVLAAATAATTSGEAPLWLSLPKLWEGTVRRYASAARGLRRRRLHGGGVRDGVRPPPRPLGGRGDDRAGHHEQARPGEAPARAARVDEQPRHGGAGRGTAGVARGHPRLRLRQAGGRGGGVGGGVDGDEPRRGRDT